MSKFVNIVTILLMLTFSVSTELYAQRKKAKPVVKVAEPTEDFSEYINNPVCKVIIADSMVVDLSAVSSTIILPEYVGKLLYDKDTELFSYENSFGDHRLMTMPDSANNHCIYNQTMLGNDWGKLEKVTVNGDLKDIINPFLSIDGQTLFFSAKTDDNSSYQLYTTTFDSESHSYLAPQPLPYPFKSDKDDLLYIEDETDSLAWYVTRHGQEAGKVCIYTMRQHSPWQFYDSEETSPQHLKTLALLNNISATWPSEKSRDDIRTEILNIKQNSPARPNPSESMCYVINDKRVIHSASEFIKAESLQKYNTLVYKTKEYEKANRECDEYRRLYKKSSVDGKNKLSEIISYYDDLMVKLSNEIKELNKEIRLLEQ